MSAFGKSVYCTMMLPVLALASLLLPFSMSAQTITLAGGAVIHSVAGTPQQSGYTGDGGPAGQATLGYTYGVAVDASGNYYIADAANSVIRVVNTQKTAITVANVQIQPGDIATVAGNGQAGYSGDNGPATSAQIDWPYAVAVDNSGNIYIADTNNNVIREVTSGGTITTFAGVSNNGQGCDVANGYSGDGGPATQAIMNCPLGVAADSSGNVYIADTYNNVVRMVNSGGIINTVAGNGTGHGNGCDAGGYSGDGGPATQAELNCVVGVSVDAAGNFYIADLNNEVLRVVNTQSSAVTIGGVLIQPGNINTVAGNGTPGYSGDGGQATQAQLNYPWSSSVDAQGNIFISDSENYVVREVSSQGVISTYAGDGTFGYAGDGGPANQAELSWVHGIAVSGSGNVYIDDSDNYVVRMSVAGGGLSQDFGQVNLGNTNGEYVQLQFNAPITINGVQTSGDFSILPGCRDCNSVHRQNVRSFDANRVHLPRRIAQLLSKHVASGGRPQIQIRENSSSVCTGSYQQGDTCSILIQFAPTQPGFRTAPLVLTDSNSVEYSVGLTGTGVGSTLAFTPGLIHDVAGDGTFGYAGDGGPATSAELAEPLGVVRDGAGNLYIADGQNNVVRKVDTYGNISTVAGNGTAGYTGDGGPATSAELWFPFGLSMDSGGNLYIADIGNSVIRRVDINGIITTVAGNGSFGYTGDNGSALSAQLANPVGVMADNLGNLYIADTFNNVIRKVNAYGIITTVAGNGYGAGSGGWMSGTAQGGYSGDGGPATQAELFSPFGISMDAAGNLYIADSQNSVVREVSTAGMISTVAGECPNGTCQYGYTGDGGPATSAQLAFPTGVAFDSAGEMFIADAYNSAIRRVDVLGNISTVAGDGSVPNVVKSHAQILGRRPAGSKPRGFIQVGSSGGGGIATGAQLGIPASIALDNAGNFYFADAEADIVWQVNVTSSLLAFGDELVGGASNPQSVTVGNAGNATLNLSQISVASGFTNASNGQTACSTENPVSVGGNCAVSVTFNPTEAGSYNGSVTITDDAFNSPQSVSLTGTGTINNPVDTSLGFVKAPPANLPVGSAVGVIKVGVYDSNSNLDTNSTASVTVTITGPNSFLSAKTAQAAVGVATLDFSQVALPAAGQYSVQATSGNLTPATVGIVVGSAADYSISANPTSLTVTAGNSGTVTLTVSPTGGYTGTVNFSCAGLPPYSACTFAPASASLDGSNTPVTVKLTVDTSGANHTARLEVPPTNHGSPVLPASLWFVQAGLAGVVLTGSASDRRRRSRQIWLRAGLLVVFFAAMLVATGCGFSQGGSSSGGGSSNPVTPAGTYNATVTATASGGSGTHHSVTVKIVVE